MSIDLWRIDATHDAGGAVTFFRATNEEAYQRAGELRAGGWKAAVRPADSLPINDVQGGYLIAGTWPNAGREEILALLNSARQQASDQLREVMHKRDKRFDRKPQRPSRR